MRVERLTKEYGWGSVLTMDLLEDANRTRIVRDFLQKLSIEMAKGNGRFFERYLLEDYPLRYDERRMAGLVTASIGKITDVFMAEFAVKRGSKKRVKTKPIGHGETQGRMDYWVFYRGIDIGMEVKRSYISTRMLAKPAGKGTAVLKKAWESCITQATSVREDILNWPSKDPIGLAFLTVFVWENSKSKKWPTTVGTEEALAKIQKADRTLQKASVVAWHVEAERR